MQSPLNDFILSLFTPNKDVNILEKKLDLVRDHYFEEKQKLEELKLRYAQEHAQPREDYTLFLNNYLEKLHSLRNTYQKNPLNKGALHNWLKESATFPPELQVVPSKIFTYYK